MPTRPRSKKSEVDGLTLLIFISKLLVMKTNDE